MGLGDELMAIGQALECGAGPTRPAVILDRHGRPRTHALFDAVPWLVTDPAAPVAIINGPSARPYVDYDRTTKERWAYTEWRCSPGVMPGIRWRPPGRRRIYLEPLIKVKASPNKQWGAERWVALAADLENECQLVQGGPARRSVLPGAEFVITESFAHAVEVMARCDLAILPEGGMHHAAAAIGMPAIVLFGGMTRPINTGYSAHINLAVDDPAALGWRIPHPACDAAWRRITPADVAATARRALDHPAAQKVTA